MGAQGPENYPGIPGKVCPIGYLSQHRGHIKIRKVRRVSPWN